MVRVDRVVHKMSDNLLPCPFCGGTNLEIAHAADKNGTYDWKVACADCYILHETEEQAIASWNRRGIPGPVTDTDIAKWLDYLRTVEPVDRNWRFDVANTSE